MSSFENNADELNCICDKVRFAISVGDELDDEMSKHLDECEECRTFLKQTEIMIAELESMGAISFTKDGKTVADSVMQEIARQEIFTKGLPVKNKNGIFRHIGLIAACAIVVVMVIPVVRNGMINSKELSMEYAVEDSGIDAALMKSEPEVGLSTYMMDNNENSSESYNYYGFCNYIVDENELATGDFYVTDNVSDEELESNYFFMSPEEEAFSDDAITTESTNEINEEIDKDASEMPSLMLSQVYRDTSGEELYEIYENGGNEPFETIEEAAMQAALLYCEGRADIIADSIGITIADNNKAYAVFELSDGSKITVYLLCNEGMWTVSDVCDGDITE